MRSNQYRNQLKWYHNWELTIPLRWYWLGRIWYWKSHNGAQGRMHVFCLIHVWEHIGVMVLSLPSGRQDLEVMHSVQYSSNPIHMHPDESGWIWLEYVYMHNCTHWYQPSLWSCLAIAYWPTEPIPSSIALDHLTCWPLGSRCRNRELTHGITFNTVLDT
jgi:hypothetical protein